MLNRLLPATLVVIAALSLTAASALAKGVESVAACGADNQCATAGEGEFDDQVIFSSTSGNPPDRPEPFYRVEVEMIHGGGEITLSVLPSSGLAYSRDRIGGTLWSIMSAEQQAFYSKLTAGLTPISAGKLEGVSNPPLPASNTSPPPPDDPAPADDGGSSALPWLIGLAALTGLVLAVVLRRARRRSAPPATA